MSLLVGSLLAASQVLGCALKEMPGAEDKTRAALPDGTQMPGEWMAPEWDTGVAAFQSAIAEGQLFPGGQLASVQQRRMVRAFPVWLSLPEDAPPDLRKLGLAARVTIMTERAQVVAIVATFMHWFKTSLDIVL